MDVGIDFTNLPDRVQKYLDDLLQTISKNGMSTAYHLGCIRGYLDCALDNNEVISVLNEAAEHHVAYPNSSIYIVKRNRAQGCKFFTVLPTAKDYVIFHDYSWLVHPRLRSMLRQHQLLTEQIQRPDEMNTVLS